MLHRVVTASLQNVVKADNIALDINIGVVDGVADTSLGCEIDYDVKLIFRKKFIYQLTVGNGAPIELVNNSLRYQFLQFAEPVLFEGNIIVGIHVVDAHYDARLQVMKETLHQISANESSRTGN